MKSIRKAYDRYALLFLISSFLAMWFGRSSIYEASFVFGIICIVSLLLFMRQSRLLYDARLIWDNPILLVSSVLISIPDHQTKKDAEETVVSTFGVLIGSKVYRWGLDGVHGVRLHKVYIDEEWMHLTFGDENQTMKIELLHGIGQKQQMLDAAEKLLHETGIAAKITGW